MPNRQREGAATSSAVSVLRRRSWPVLAGVAFISVGLMNFSIVLAELADGNRGEPAFLAAITLAIMSSMYRMGTCKIVLRDSSLQVDNFFSRCLVDYRAISRVDGSPAGGLGIHLRDGSGISPFAFGGSLVDALFKTSERAAGIIGSRLDGERISARPAKTATVIRRARPCPVADGLLAVAVIAALIGPAL